ncbi:conserved hypothetical protein [Flavobacterium sp. 9AF]|uniref:hypothetical protein n=1 Tax=Flavobacterium sp. 9AF TaxID=2653142 RepID=UPI0012F0FCE5|nr:hypothetical protein [Flavobacterium sp. 9AF]VXB71876.1 conserved hypothetical protein [Flavobacterium sp. 9AF]
MNKIWKLNESKSNKLILIREKVIYKGNPKIDDLNRVNSETTDFSFLKDLFSIPYSYIKQIENQKGKNYIKIFFGKDSQEKLYIDNENIKNEVFEFIKSENKNLKYSSEIPSIKNYAKGQLFALLTLTGIFIWSLYLAIQIESGVEYELVGHGNPGITGVVLIISNLGSLKIIVGYIILLVLAILALKNKLKSRSETEFLKR